MLDRFPAYIIRLEMHDLQRNNIQWRKKMKHKEVKLKTSTDLNDTHIIYAEHSYCNLNLEF
jgi:hypothetical protein